MILGSNLTVKCISARNQCFPLKNSPPCCKCHKHTFLPDPSCSLCPKPFHFACVVTSKTLKSPKFVPCNYCSSGLVNPLLSLASWGIVTYVWCNTDILVACPYLTSFLIFKFCLTLVAGNKLRNGHSNSLNTL